MQGGLLAGSPRVPRMQTLPRVPSEGRVGRLPGARWGRPCRCGLCPQCSLLLCPLLGQEGLTDPLPSPRGQRTPSPPPSWSGKSFKSLQSARQAWVKHQDWQWVSPDPDWTAAAGQPREGAAPGGGGVVSRTPPPLHLLSVPLQKPRLPLEVVPTQHSACPFQL